MCLYLLKRILQSMLVLLAMSFLVYGMIGLMPGDPIDLMISGDPSLSSKDADQLKELYGVKKPILERYSKWLFGIFNGDLGFSRLFAKPVFDVLAGAIQNTAILMGVSFLIAFLCALPLGALAAIYPRSKIDLAINTISFIGISIPPFWLAILLIITFSVYLGIFPAGGQGPYLEEKGVLNNLSYLTLPIMCLVIANIGGYVRYIRAALREILRLDYIRTARAKGLSKQATLLNHAFRAGMIPVITIVSLDFGYLFSGALITETIFSLPGMGKLIFDAIMGNDFNLALAGLLFATFFTLSGSLLADIAYVLIDPRVSYIFGDKNA